MLSDNIFAELSRLLSKKEQQQLWDREDTQRHEDRVLRWKRDAETRLLLKQNIDTSLATRSLKANKHAYSRSSETSSTIGKTARLSKYVAIAAAAGAGILTVVSVFALQNVSNQRKKTSVVRAMNDRLKDFYGTSYFNLSC